MIQRADVYHLPDKQLTLKEQDLAKTFHTLCVVDVRSIFTSDAFRMYGLDRFINDKAHGIGGFFAKLVVNGLIEQIGWARSILPTNHGRSIRLYRWIKQ